MRLQGASRRVVLVLILSTSFVVAGGVVRARQQSDPNQVAAKVERAPLYLVSPDRYRVPSLLEPIRRVQIIAPADGVLKSLSLPVGSTTREGQEVGQMDPAEAIAHSKIAAAKVKEMQAELEVAKELAAKMAIAQASFTAHEAKVDAAKAQLELAQIELDRCILRAPFAGRILSVPVTAGQYLPKGSVVLELADTANLKALIPVDRTAVSVGSKILIQIEGKGVNGTVLAILPLDESRAALRELASPLSAAWVVVSNTDNALEPGQRVLSPYVPNSPIASVASYSIKQDEQGKSLVQVIRSERVTDVPVQIIGALGPDRSQVAGLFRPSDVLIQSSSVPLVAGTFIRFADNANYTSGVEGIPPAPGSVGEPAAVGGSRIAPIGSPDAPGTRRAPSTSTKPATKPATRSGGVPF